MLLKMQVENSKDVDEKKKEGSLERIIKYAHREDYINYGLAQDYLTHRDEEVCSQTMTAEMVAKIKLGLADTLVPGSKGWSLVYSTEKHGYSLGTLMTKAKSMPRSGHYILACLESAGTEKEYERVFGAAFHGRLEYNAMSFGTPGSALFRFRTYKPRDQGTERAGKQEGHGTMLSVYTATPESTGFYIMAKKTYLAFGCSNARFGLMLDQSLLKGESHPVSTYNNERLSHRDKFTIKKLELWHILP